MEQQIMIQQPTSIAAERPGIPLDNINQGTVAIESSRAVAEAQGKLVIAKRFPRDEVAAYNRMIEACRRKGLAEKAFYAYNRAGSTVEGPSIRLAEELARCYGNIDYGIKELSQDAGKSEMQAYAWDLETNTMSVQNFTNLHVREVSEFDKVAGRKQTVLKPLVSTRDVYEINANMGARRLRARILAILPTDYVDAAIKECKKTIGGSSDEPLIDRVKKLVVAFGGAGVRQEQLEARLGRKIETMTVDDLTEHLGIYNAIKNKESTVADWFEPQQKNADDLTKQLAGE